MRKLSLTALVLVIVLASLQIGCDRGPYSGYSDSSGSGAPAARTNAHVHGQAGPVQGGTSQMLPNPLMQPGTLPLIADQGGFQIIHAPARAQKPGPKIVAVK